MENIIFLSLVFSFQIFSHQLENRLIVENQAKSILRTAQENIQVSDNKLKKFEGVYRFAPGNEMKIYIEDTTLKALLPGQPEYTLLPSGKMFSD